MAEVPQINLTPISYYYELGKAECTNNGYTPPPGFNENFLDEELVAQIADTSTVQTWDPDEIAVAWLRDQALYRDLVQDTVDYTSNSVLSSFIAATDVTEIHDIEELEELIRMSLEDSSLIYLAQAKAINTLLQGSEYPLVNTDEFYSIFLPELEEEDGNYEFDESELAALRVIAQKCPYTHGAAVYQARALLDLADLAIVDYTSACELGYQNGTAKTGGLPADALVDYNTNSIQESSSLYPNPASTHVEYLFESSIGYSNLNLEVFNVYGQNLLSQKLEVNQSVQLDLSVFENGMYLFKLSENNREIETKKLIIAH